MAPELFVIDTYKTADAIIAACLAAKALAPIEIPPDTEGLRPFEHVAWEIGENIRKSFQTTPKFRKDLNVLHAILDVIQYRNLGRGRESFVMALGFTGAAMHAQDIAQFINDPTLGGHAVDTLLKMRAPGFSGEVSPLIQHKQAWVRRLANKYLERYGVPSNNSFKRTAAPKHD